MWSITWRKNQRRDESPEEPPVEPVGLMSLGIFDFIGQFMPPLQRPEIPATHPGYDHAAKHTRLFLP